MAQLIDTSVFVELERRGEPLSTLEATIPGQSVALAAITASELLVGVSRAESTERRRRRASFVETVLAAFPILAFDLGVARIHARLLATLTATGQRIGANDLLIAATAVAHGHDVLTHNLREFGRVPGLVVHRPGW